MGIMHTHKSLLSSFYSPDNAANHWIDQAIGESLACGNWFFHMTGLYSVTLSAVYGISLYTLSEYSNEAFVEMIVDNKIATASVYPWQVKFLHLLCVMNNLFIIETLTFSDRLIILLIFTNSRSDIYVNHLIWVDLTQHASEC